MKITQLQKTYKAEQVLSVSDFPLNSAGAHGLLGANGAGKSTLIKIIMGLVFADSGEVSKPDNIAYLPEFAYLPLNLTAKQVVAHACRIQQHSNYQDRLSEVCLREEVWDKPIRTYSKGMKQRTAIAYALAGQPEWLILDEPMSGLDAMGRSHILDILEQRKKNGVNILMCSHAITDLVRLCNKVHIMAAGKVCESIEIHDHSMQEVEHLEYHLRKWSV